MLTGLSPRVRGNRMQRGLNQFRGGPIPACAGQPTLQHSSPFRLWAYPRVCGATWATPSISALVPGLSPRVRGNRSCAVRYPLRAGPIPACAGQPGEKFATGAASRAYPRVCGATRCICIRCWLCRAYPRVCGATPRGTPDEVIEWGLSPRVRGNPNPKTIALGAMGPIPACAGQPECRKRATRECRAYPRVCGATSPAHSDGLEREGLSPRVRGNHKAQQLPSDCLGPIPACAGQPAGLESGLSGPGAYPRVCGATFQSNCKG